jgi:hypothetical protein
MEQMMGLRQKTEADIEAEAAVAATAIATTMRAPDGTDYKLGVLEASITMLQVKRRLAELSPISVGCQQLYHMEDTRSEEGEEGETDLELKDGETVWEVRRYGAKWTEATALKLFFVVDDVVVCKFDHLVPSKGIDSPGQFDKEGVLYMLGSHAGAREWVNPHESKEVVAAMSSVLTVGRPEKLVWHEHPGGNNFNWTQNEPNSWASIDLGAGRALRLDHYALRHGYWDGIGRLKNWDLEGSNNGSSWVRLKRHENDRSLPDVAYSVAVWAVEGVQEEYRHFRIRQTGRNWYSSSRGRNALYCGGIELYGELREAVW